MTHKELIDHLQNLEQYTHYSEDAPALREVIEMLKCSEMPNGSEERTEERTETHACDLISRQAAIHKITANLTYLHTFGADRAVNLIEELPSAQPEQKCVNCGRTVNNGGWYEDGRTKCPIEEHYALPKDGYCHLWEKRKDWEDDYVKRPEEGEK